jgi:rubrerythrin
MAMLEDIMDDLRSTTTKHYECRECGTNLSTEDTECPTCGGTVSVHRL